jgi:hypothetical protein
VQGFDSHSSTNNQEWFLFNAAQLCPAAVFTVKAIEDRRTGEDD